MWVGESNVWVCVGAASNVSNVCCGVSNVLDLSNVKLLLLLLLVPAPPHTAARGRLFSAIV